MPTLKSNELFIDELKIKGVDVIPLDPYVNSSTRIRFKCSLCNYVWLDTPSHILSGRGCPECKKERNRISRENVFMDRLSLLNPNLEVISKYYSFDQYVTIRCRRCGTIRKVTPSSLLQGTGCSKCNKRHRRNTEEFKEELERINPNIIVLGTYKNAHTGIKVKCKRCGAIWIPEANTLLKGVDCSICSHDQSSIIEQIIYISFCELLGENKVKNRDRSIIGKELDIYIPSLSLAIEFGAWYWHKDRLENDIEKEKRCKEHTIKLLTIYEGFSNGQLEAIPENSVCFESIISNEKEFLSIKELLLQISLDYNLDKDIICTHWSSIVNKAKLLSHKKTEEDFSIELSETNPSIVYVSGYKGAKNSVRVMCIECGKKWDASSAYDLLHGHGCPNCGIKKRSLSNRLSESSFLKRVARINPQLIVQGKYKGSSQKVLCICSNCGHEWNPIASTIMYKHRNCPTCTPNTRKTTEKYSEQVRSISRDIVLLEDYYNSKTPVLLQCLKCGYIWAPTPNQFLSSKGCPKCNNQLKMTNDEFVRKVSIKNNKIIVLGEYIDSKTRVKCKCSICGHEWPGIPYNLLRGAGCRKCAGTLKLTNDEFLQRLSIVNPTIKPLEPYVNRKTDILCECLICLHRWPSKPDNLLNGHGCPNCKNSKIRKMKEKPIICIETGKVYGSISVAKLETGITTISDCLHKRTKTAGSYHWEFYKKGDKD